jgi:hypothetical protein
MHMAFKKIRRPGKKKTSCGNRRLHYLKRNICGLKIMHKMGNGFDGNNSRNTNLQPNLPGYNFYNQAGFVSISNPI